MATIDSPSQLGTSTEVEPTFKAMRVTNRPLEYIQYGSGGQTRVLGHYKLVTSTGAFLWSASAVLFTFRYTDPASIAVLTRFSVGFSVATAVTAQALGFCPMYKIIGYTADPTTNIALTVVSTQMPQAAMRTGMGSPNAHMGAATAAAGITGYPAGSQTQSGMGFAPIPALTAIGTGTPVLELYNVNNASLIAHPLALANNEGFNVYWPVNALATGTVSCMCVAEWAEVAEF